MTKQQGMRANEIVALFAALKRIDLTTIATVVEGLPRANLQAWLRGRQENLRASSVVRLLDLVGLKVKRGGGVLLDDTRVHLWDVADGLLARSSAAYRPVIAVSRLLRNCAITRVEPPKRGVMAKKSVHVYLVSGPGVRVVIRLSKSPFKRSRITPEWLRGTMWRDGLDDMPSSDHVVGVTAEKWRMLMNRDLECFEFDQMFDQNEPRLTWGDVSLLAREYAVTPDRVRDMILAESGHGVASETADADQAEDNEIQVRDYGTGTVIRLHHDRDPLVRRTAAG